MTKKKPLMIQIDDVERMKIELLADKWGSSLSGVIRRLIREYEVKK